MQGMLNLKPQLASLMVKFFIGIYLKNNCGLLQAWIELHRDELVADWELAVHGETPYKIAPL